MALEPLSPDTLVVHTHFHRRRTGITTHVDAVTQALGRTHAVRALGWQLSPTTPRLTWRRLWEHLRQGPIVWHAHRNLEALLGLFLRTFTRRVRVVFTRHSGTAPSAFTSLLFRLADVVVSLTPTVAALLPVHSTVVPHGVNLARFTPPTDRAQAWKALARGGELGLGVIGRVRPSKGQGDFAAALEPLLPRFPRWKAIVIGTTKVGDDAWARAHVRHPIDRVEEVTNPAPWYRGLSIVVHPSHSEAYSLVLLEALAAGCCVVATSLPQARALITHGENGFLFPPGDVEALRAVLEPLLADPALVTRVGERAARFAREHLSVDVEARALLAVYGHARALG